MNNPLISIIVPIYNVESFLRDCLDSIANQRYSNIEVILVDDGTPDNSGHIADSYAQKDLRFKVIHQKNKGVSSARNTGLEIAKGEYICFADSDDLLEPDYVEYLYNLSTKNNVDIALTTSMFSSYGDKQMTKEKYKVVKGVDAVIAILHYFIPIGCYCKLFKKSIINSHIRFLPDVYIGEGFNFNVDAFLRADKVAIGNRKIYKYRRDNDQSAMTLFKAHKCEMALRAIDIIRDKLPVNPYFEESYKYAKWHTASNMHDWIVLAGAQNDYQELFDECRKWVRDYSKIALFAKSNSQDRLRAILQSIHPSLMPALLKLRRKIYL